MSAMLEALRAQYEADLKCPKCGGENIPHFVTVHLISTSRADCDGCGFSGAIELFLPPVKL